MLSLIKKIYLFIHRHSLNLLILKVKQNFNVIFQFLMLINEKLK